MQKEELKFANSTLFEGMTSIRAIIDSYRSGTNDRKIERILFDKDKLKKNAKEIGYLKAVSFDIGYTIEAVDGAYLDEIALGNTHGGIVCYASQRTIPELSYDNINGDFYVMIEGIEDPYNFGYALRSLYACGCSGVVLPRRNWMSAAGVVARSSAGASERFELFNSDAISAVDIFKKKGFSIVCAEEKTDNVLGKCPLKKPILLIIGGEKRGISSAVRDLADTLVKIEYSREFNASLSAASATTMFAYEIQRQNS